MSTFNNCTPASPESWFDWQRAEPSTPLDLFANIQLVMGANTDQGVFIDSPSYAVPPVPPNLLRIVGGRVIATSGLKTLASLQNPISTLVVGDANTPNRVEVDFNNAPDSGTVTTSSFTISGIGGISVPSATVTMSSSTTARMDLATALTTGTYAIQMNGTTSPVVSLTSAALDGEAINLPSGTGVAGGDFLFGVNVVSGSKPLPAAAPALPPANFWNSSQIAVTSQPQCIALESDNLQMVADAAQWNFRHLTALLGPFIPTPLNKTLYVRGGEGWQINVPLSLGTLGYSELQISVFSNIATRGDCQGTMPAVLFNKRTYSGNVTLQLTMKKLGVFSIGIRAIDTNGYYSMFSLILNIVR